MDKLIKLIIGTAIGVVFLFIIGGLVALLILLVSAIIIWLINKFKIVKEYTKWELDRYYKPRITRLKNGELVFQSIKCLKRYNNFKNTWEFKKEIDPVQKPLSEATILSDIYWFQFI